MKKKPLKIISLFAGAVGMDLGFKNAGFEIMWVNDFDPDSEKILRTISKVFKSVVFPELFSPYSRVKGAILSFCSSSHVLIFFIVNSLYISFSEFNQKINWLKINKFL